MNHSLLQRSETPWWGWRWRWCHLQTELRAASSNTEIRTDATRTQWRSTDRRRDLRSWGWTQVVRQRAGNCLTDLTHRCVFDWSLQAEWMQRFGSCRGKADHFVCFPSLCGSVGPAQSICIDPILSPLSSFLLAVIIMKWIWGKHTVSYMSAAGFTEMNRMVRVPKQLLQENMRTIKAEPVITPTLITELQIVMQFSISSSF